jgi:glycosyltransferase involved in cell wall biosynthesis
LVAVSEYTAQQTERAFGIRRPVVIHNGIDLDGPFQPDKSRLPAEPFRLLFVGSWSIRKGVDLLGPILQELGARFELCITATRGQLRSVKELPTTTRFLGRVSGPAEIAALYREADALLFPTRLEGLPLVAIEAMACGLPVVATRGSSLPELVGDGVSGLLCEQDDVKGFAAAVRRLAEDQTLWQQMRLAARARIEAQFSLEVMIERYADLYQELLDQLQ